MYAHWLIESSTSKWTFESIESIPHNKVGMILGTSRKLSNGNPNLYFRYRIEAAVALYKAKKVDFLLVSGDNSLSYYNEPMDMKKALMEKGVPEEHIYLDYAGFRTLDSVVRGQKIFGQNRFTIISQAFHHKRAVFIARARGIEAVGFNARDVRFGSGIKTQFRELFARVLVIMDLYLLNTQPKFLGKPIPVGNHLPQER
jgi:SanA protein